MGLIEGMKELRQITESLDSDYPYLLGAANVILRSIRNGELHADQCVTAIDNWLEAYSELERARV